MRVFKTKQEFQELANSDIFHEPRLLILQASLKLFAKGQNPDSTMELIVDSFPHVKSLIMIMRNMFTNPFVSFYLLYDGTLSDLNTLIENTLNILSDLGEFILYHTEMDISTHLNETALAKKFDLSSPVLPMNAYYIPWDKHDKLSKLQLQLPEEFEFVDLKPETDAALISSTWHCAKEFDILNTKSKITHLPSVGVKSKDQLAAFEILYQTGILNHLYTLPEFRGKGLAKAVELKLCQELVAIDIFPFKCVAIGNAIAMPMADSSSFWEKVFSGTEPAILDYRDITRK